MTSPKDTADSLWLRATSQVQRPSTDAWYPGQSPAGQRSHHVKADETTRKVRELNNAATDQRHANVARLKQARLDKEAEDQARAVPDASEKGSRSKR